MPVRVCAEFLFFLFFSCRVLDERGEEKIPGDKEAKAIRVCPPSLLFVSFLFLLTHKTFRILFLSHLSLLLQKLLSPPF